MSVIRTRVGDVPRDRYVLVTDPAGATLNITGGTVTFLMYTPVGHTVVTRNLTVVPPSYANLTFGASDFGTAGRYLCDLKIEFASGKTETAFDFLDLIVEGFSS